MTTCSERQATSSAMTITCRWIARYCSLKASDACNHANKAWSLEPAQTPRPQSSHTPGVIASPTLTPIRYAVPTWTERITYDSAAIFTMRQQKKTITKMTFVNLVIYRTQRLTPRDTSIDKSLRTSGTCPSPRNWQRSPIQYISSQQMPNCSI